MFVGWGCGCVSVAVAEPLCAQCVCVSVVAWVCGRVGVGDSGRISVCVSV